MKINFFLIIFDCGCFQGVDNVYAQHVPLIKDLLDQLLRGKLKDTSYPNVNSKEQINSSQQQGQMIK
jgi:peptide methionine sulfoxide reductase MsrA